MKTVLLLEDNTDRIAAFREAVTALGEGWRVQVWYDAANMIAECEDHLEHAALISLDHDLERQPGSARDPGTGLGNGSLATAPDTVPCAVWCAANHLNDYVGALIAAVSCGGDCDTNAAIVGGITALYMGRPSIPAEWRMAREALPFPQLNESR